MRRIPVPKRRSQVAGDSPGSSPRARGLAYSPGRAHASRPARRSQPHGRPTRTLPPKCLSHIAEVDMDVEVHLERVLGISVQNNAGLTCDLNTGTVAYPAGCVVVLYSSKRHRQSFIQNRKSVTAVHFSRDGKFLVTGETGHQPQVRVWEAEERACVAEFSGHNFGVRCVAFSPSGRYLVSVGSQHDMMVNVWDWKQRLKIASSKVSSKVNAMAFAEDGHCFLTAGNRHVRFWYMDVSRAKVKETIPLQGRNAILGDLKNNNFTDVAVGRGDNRGKTFVISQAGHLCQFNEKRLLVKWVELKTPSATCLSISDSCIFVGCAAGVVRFFDADSLHYVTTLPRPHPLGVDVAAPPEDAQTCSPNGIEYADVTALVYDSVLQRVTVVYNDHSLYVWDVRDAKKIGKVASHLYHSGCVWGVDTCASSLSAGSLLTAPSLGDQRLPRDAFVTCSADNTIRVWSLDLPPHSSHGNIYSPNLMKVLYIDPELVNLCDREYNPASPMGDPLTSLINALSAGTTDKTDTSYEMKQGVRVVKISPDGLHLASGDREGNIRIHSLESWEELKVIEAHEAEVLSLDYFQSQAEPDLILLSSTSRDRLIHVFDPAQDYFVVQTLGDHSAAVFSARLVESASGDIRMVSCGSDKSILIRVLEPNDTGTSAEFYLENHVVGHHSQYDMAVDPGQRYFATACQDRTVRIYNIHTGKQRKAYRGSLADDGTLLRCALDPSGAYLATAGSDKQLYLLDFHTGEVQAQVGGHAELVLGVRFLPDLKHVVSVSADGCIFVWRLPPDMTLHMRHRLKEAAAARPAPGPEDFTPAPDPGPSPEPPTPALPEALLHLVEATPPRPAGDASGFRFSVSVLPSWAQKKFSRRDSIAQMSLVQAEAPADSGVVQGVWAERAGAAEELLPGEAEPPPPPALSRRCSLVPVPRVVQDDGSNVEEDAEDEFAQNEHRRDSCCVAHRRASIQSAATQALSAGSGPGADTESQQTGSTEENEEEEEECELPVIFFPSTSQEEEEVGVGSAYPVIAVNDDANANTGAPRPQGLAFKAGSQDLPTPNSEEDETRDVLEEFDMVLEDHDEEEPLMTRSMEIPGGDSLHETVFGSCSQLAIQGVSGRESLSRKFLSKQSSPSFPSLISQRARKAANTCLPKSATQPRSRPPLAAVTGGKLPASDPTKRKDSLSRAAEATNRRLQKMASSRTQQQSGAGRRRSSTQSNASTTSKRSTAAAPVEEPRKAPEEPRGKRGVRPGRREPQSARAGPSRAPGGSSAASAARSVSSERSPRPAARQRPSYEQATSASLARASRAADLRRAPSMGSVQAPAGARPPSESAPPPPPAPPAPAEAPRAQWDLRRKRDVRKSCPVQMLSDINAARDLVRAPEPAPLPAAAAGREHVIDDDSPASPEPPPRPVWAARAPEESCAEDALPDALARAETSLQSALRCCEEAPEPAVALARPHVARLDGLLSQLRARCGLGALVPVDTALVEPLLCDIGERICSEVQRRLSLQTGAAEEKDREDDVCDFRREKEAS